MKQAENALIFIVEGDTEEHFYDRVLSCLQIRQRFSGKCKIINAKSVSRIQNKGFSKCKNYIAENGLSNSYIFICYDSDVFRRGQKPPLDYIQLKKKLETLVGVQEVNKIVAVEQIEDWFLLDFAGICNYLGIIAKSIKGLTGEDKLKQLFKTASKVYVKGKNIDAGRFIDSLDINLLIGKIKPELVRIDKIITSFNQLQ